MNMRESSNKRGNRNDSLCLGQPSHTVTQGKVLCEVCGHLVMGATLGIYQVEQLLGHGRSGAAYLVQHHRLHQKAVMKVFPPNKETTSLWEVARQEALAFTQVQHPSILPMSSCAPTQLELQPERFRTQQGPVLTLAKGGAYLLSVRPYVAFPLFQFLTRLISSGMAVTNETEEQNKGAMLAQIIQQIGAALSHAHAYGIVHGALIPDNVLLNNQAHCWIADFGLARLHPPLPPYLPPELFSLMNAEPSPQRATALWNAVTPFCDQYMLAVLCQSLLTSFFHPRYYVVGLPVLQKAMHENPTRRFPTVSDFVNEMMKALLVGRRSASSDTGPTLRLQTSSGPLVLEQQERVSRLPSQDYRLAATPPPQTSTTSSLVARIRELERLGGKLFTAHSYPEAIRAYQDALTLDSRNASLWLALGDTFLASERYTEASSAYENCIVLNPKDAEAWTNRGMALEMLGRRREAQTCYERASQLRDAGEI